MKNKRHDDNTYQVSDIGIGKIILSIFKKLKKFYIIYAVLILCMSISQPVSTIIWGKLFDGLVNQSSLFFILLYLTTYLLLNFIANNMEKHIYGMNDIDQLPFIQNHRFREVMEVFLFNRLLKIPYEYYETSKIHDKINRTITFVTHKYNGLGMVIVNQVFLMIGQLTSIIIFIILLFNIHILLCFISFLSIIPAIFTTHFAQKLEYYFIKDNTELYRKMNYFQDVLTNQNAAEIKTLNAEQFFYQKWEKSAQTYYTNEKRTVSKITYLELIKAILTYSVVVLLILFAGYLLVHDSISIQNFSVVVLVGPSLIQQFIHLFTSIGTVLSKKRQLKELLDILEMQYIEDNHTSPTNENNSKPICLTLQNIKYHYPNSQTNILKGINFTLKDKEKVAIVGLNGSGKSTLIKVILGLLKAEGEYLINNKTVSTINHHALVNHFSCVLQNPPRFTTFTLQQNINMSDYKKDDMESFQKALSFVGIHYDYHQKLNKMLGGIDLSGGEWQKLSIAKTVFRNREILILDEPTSNIDPLKEIEIYKQYLEISNDSTVIYVTHRMSTAALADRIIVLDNGKIIEEGSFKKLMNDKKKFYKLYSTQNQWYT